jgi:hypothetical protein
LSQKEERTIIQKGEKIKFRITKAKTGNIPKTVSNQGVENTIEIKMEV